MKKSESKLRKHDPEAEGVGEEQETFESNRWKGSACPKWLQEAIETLEEVRDRQGGATP